jgi:hypothetical protein
LYDVGESAWSSVRALVVALEDPKEEVREDAMRALSRIDPMAAYEAEVRLGTSRLIRGVATEPTPE